MNPLVYHIVSGQAFFTGIVLLVVAAVASMRFGRIRQRIFLLGSIIGLIAVIVSSTPLSYWWYIVAAAAMIAWGFSAYRQLRRRTAAFVAIAMWIVLALVELPYQVTRPLLPAKDRSLTVIGDSVSAGVGGDEKSETWPRILAREQRLDVQDLSHVGETAASALKRAKAEGVRSSVVFIEIGGNDLLGSTSAEKFATDLDALLAHLRKPGRQIIMLELPLPPFRHEYGRIQRDAARKHGVNLVPKRVFLSILAGGDATLDTIHLSQRGHQRMADCVWALVDDAYSGNAEAKL